MQFSNPQYSIQNVDTYRYDGSLDQLYNEKEEIWEHKRFYWEKDFENITNDCAILTNEIVDSDNVRVFMEMMSLIEDNIIKEQKEKSVEPRFLNLLNEFKETQVFQTLMKVLVNFNDALAKKNIYSKIKSWQMCENTLNQLKAMCQWMKGDRFKVDQQMNQPIFHQLLNQFNEQEGIDFEQQIKLQIKNLKQLKRKNN